jgi:hypothetical protein
MGTHTRVLRDPAGGPASRSRPWPLLAIAAPAAVAIWTGWVGLGGKCGFGLVQPLPGIVSWHLNTAITLPVGIEAYAAYALSVWLVGNVGDRTRVFARKSAIGALALGCLGQIAFHLLAAAGWAHAPWPVVMAVACLPVATLGFGATLFHLQWADHRAARDARDAEIEALRAEAAEARARAVAAGAEADAVRGQAAAALEAAEFRAAEAERREAEAAGKTEILTRKLAAATARKSTRKAPAKKDAPAGRGKPAEPPADGLPADFDASTQALSILAAEPDISGAKLAERVGMSERWGQGFKKNLAAASASNGSNPEE